MWKPENRVEFEQIVGDLLNDPDVQSMKHLPQHAKDISCLDHSIYVAYLTFLFCRRFHLDHVAATRAALLHDFYLCDWEEEGTGMRRLWTHPHMALKNAQDRYDLSELEQDIIVKHMWPLTRPLPKHRESFVVTVADKLCAAMEMSRLCRLFKMKKNLVPAAAAA